VIFRPEMVDKILAGEKTVTRRPVKLLGYQPNPAQMPCRYEVGKDYAVQPGRGLKAVARIRVSDVRREQLFAIDTADARREGFDGGPEFAAYWRKLYGSFIPTQLVDRIEFQLLHPAAASPKPGNQTLTTGDRLTGKTPSFGDGHGGSSPPPRASDEAPIGGVS
jgi:hypothetical protein